MRSRYGLVDDERAVMVFVLIGIVILLLSLAAGAYFARIQLQAQEEVADTAGIKELNARFEDLKNELESAVWEAGQKAVVDVQEGTNSGEGYTTAQLQQKVGENTTALFEEYFQNNHEGTKNVGDYEIHLHLRPLRSDEPHIEVMPLYIREKRNDEMRWEELPGFFNVERTVHADIRNERADTFSTRRFTINRTVQTNFFLLNEIMDSFRPERMRETVNLMTSTYVHMKIFQGGNLGEEGDWFEVPFEEHFETDWLHDYDGTSGDFGVGEDRDEGWDEEEDRGKTFALAYERDMGEVLTHDVLNEEELRAICRLALLLEQGRVFRSLDEDFLDLTAESFDIDSETLLDHLGQGVENMVNLEALVLKLFQEKGTLSEDMCVPGSFLNRSLEGGFVGIVQQNEDWVNTSFGMMKRLFEGELLSQENGGRWKFEELSEEVTPLPEVGPERSYLRALVSLYSNSMDMTFDAFKIDEPEMREYVEENISRLGPLPWMEGSRLVGEEGVEKVTESILYTARNLSVSLGFQTPSSNDGAVPFYYTYFLSDWGLDEESEKNDPEERINTRAMQDFIEGKIRNELDSQRKGYDDARKEEYETIEESIENYNETMEDHDVERDEWEEVWQDLNITWGLVENLSAEELFEEEMEENTTSALNDNYSRLEDIEGEIENKIEGWSEAAKNDTLNITTMQKNFTENKWSYEVYDFLLDVEDEKESEEALDLIEDFLFASSSELTDRYDWTLEEYRLSEDIEVPPEDPDESVGHVTLGYFVDDARTKFLFPLNYTNTHDLFRRLNLNVFDLAGSRGAPEEEMSRLWEILLGRGDPYSEHIFGSGSVIEPLDIDLEDIHSEDLSDIETWWVEESFDRSIGALKGLNEELKETADDLAEKGFSGEMEGLGDASFYRTAVMTLNSVIGRMESYGENISGTEKKQGNIFEVGDEVKSLPICNLPLGGLTVWSNRSVEYGTSYTLGLDLELESENQLIEIDNISGRGVRGYEGASSSTKEWINPFAEDHQDHYNTILFPKFNTSGIELKVDINESRVFTLEKYTLGEMSRSYAPRDHTTLAEVLTPMPLLEKRYIPVSAADHEVDNVSFHRNVFNESQRGSELSFDVLGCEEETDLTVEVVKTGGERKLEPEVWGEYNRYRNMKSEEGMADSTVLYEEDIQVESGEEKVNMSFELEEDLFPSEGSLEEHLVLRVRSEIVMSQMPDTRNLTQREYTSGEPLFSYAPSYTSAEQAYLFGGESEAYVGAFSMDEDHTDNGDFDFFDKIPKSSWLIEKDGIPFMVGFEELIEYRDVIAGVCGPAAHVEDDEGVEVVIDPRGAGTKISHLPESGYRSSLESPFVSVFMAASDEQNHFYPVKVLPHRRGTELDQKTWSTFQQRMTGRGGLVGNSASLDFPALFQTTGEIYLDGEGGLGDPGLGTGGYVYYDLEDHNGPERVEHALRPVEEFGEVLDGIKVDREKREVFYGLGDRSQVLREAEVLDEFLASNESKRAELFLAACRAGDEMEEVKELHDGFPTFGEGSIALSLDVLGENRTEQALEWFEDEYNEPAEEFRAFLSFNRTFLNELPEEVGEGNMSYKEAVEALSEELGMDFTEARGWSIKDLDDAGSLEYLLEMFKDDLVRSAVSHGFTPTALNETEYEIDIDEFSKDLDELSSSRYFVDFVQEMNSGNYENLPSFYFAARSDGSDTHWMPFGDEGAPLLIDDQIGYYNMSVSQDFSESELERLIDNTMDDFFIRLQGQGHVHSERALVIIDARGEVELGEDEKSRLKDHMRDAAERHSPERHLIGAVELRVEGEKEVRYLHL
ncbi:MAG: hypothetical protein ACOCTR_01625 [Candidatus Natronoplasma sp.]